MDESTLLGHIAVRSRGLSGSVTPAGEIVLGPGDDTAIIRSTDGRLVCVGVDHLVAGRHFDPALLGTAEGLDLVARKAIARSVSDLAATGARPAWGLATGALPAGFERGDELFDAMARWAVSFGCPLIGGDIARLDADAALVLTVTAAGAIDEGSTPLRRDGASAGDRVWITGPVGGSYRSGRHLRFEPRVSQGLAAARAGSRVTAAIDVSDGLGRDAGRVGHASGVVIELIAGDLPLHEGVADPVAACAEGEDYELLLTGSLGLAPTARQSEGSSLGGLVCIGRCRSPEAGESPGAVLVMPDGSTLDASDLGWDHGE